MNIRLAELSDLEAICALDHSYQTDHVWQLSGRNSGEEMSATLRLAKLPRAMAVRSPHDVDTLRRTVHRADFLWVIEGESLGVGVQHGIAGYLAMTLLPWQNTGWITSLAVRPDARRTGIATQLLAAAKDQARAEGMHSITIDVPTKNFPASRMCVRRGMYFCGYAENYYASHDIALFFATKIRQ
jgi:ribosomal protein S18 acetylase RimI-like enzyme